MASTYSPPALPPRPRGSGGGSGTSTVLLLVVVAVAAAAGYYYYTHVLGKSLLGGGLGAAASSSSATTPAPPPPPSAAEQKQQMAVCKAKGIVHGECELNVAAGAVYAKCDEGYYGTGCQKKCPTGPTKAVVYTPGYEGASPAGAATCVCPTSSHFQNSDLQTGCELGDATGSHCESGWHGEKCDMKGEYKNCQHGTQNASTGECDPCDAGYQGSLCQFPSDWCTKADKGATMDGDDKCVCSKDSAGNPMYAGPRCQSAGAGYLLENGTAKKWTDVWTDMSDAQITFNGAGHTSDWGKKSCGDSNNCTQTVGLCSLLSRSEGGVPGCNSLKSLCTNGQVASADGRCSLMEAGANIGNAGKIIAGATLGAVAGAATLGAAGVAAGAAGAAAGAGAGAGAAGGGGGFMGIDIANQNPWFEDVQVPKNVVFGVWKGEECGGGGEVRRKLSECVDQASCTYTSPTYQDELAFQFKLPPGHYAKCGNTYYTGPPTTSGPTDVAPKMTPGVTFKQV